jgi:hypothetical protein
MRSTWPDEGATRGARFEGRGAGERRILPFADNIEHAAKAGITAIVQPGGSMRDAEVIAACDTPGRRDDVHRPKSLPTLNPTGEP